MADNQRTLMLAIKADIEVARAQLENLVGIMGKTATDVDSRLGRIEDAFDRTSDHVSVRSQTLATTIGSTIGTTLGTILGQIPGQLLLMGEAAVESAGSIKNTAASLGIGTGALQDFRLGAASVGVEVGKADSALESFQKTTGKAANGNKAAAAAFKVIGVDIADSSGHLKPFETLIGEVADGLAKLPDPARQAAAAQQLFGESGAALLPYLDKGAKGINDLAAANELLGIKVSQDTIDRLDDLGNKAQAVQQVFTAQMAAAIANNADAIIALGNAAGSAVGYMAELLSYAKGLAAIRANEGFLAQFTSDFGRTTALGKPGGPVQVYGQEYVNAKNVRQDAEARGIPADSYAMEIYRKREADAKRLYLDAVNASEAARPPVAKPGAVVAGGLVTPPPTKPPPAAKQGRTAKPAQTIDEYLAATPVKGPTISADAGLGQLLNNPSAFLDPTKAAEKLDTTLRNTFDTHAVDDFANSIPKLTDNLDAAKAAGDELTRGLALGLASIITQSGNLGDKLVGVFARLGESLLSSGLLNLFSGGTQGTSFGTLFKGVTSLFSGRGFAAGGRPPVGQISKVGENGEEWFIPDVAGTIIPNHALRAASSFAGGGGGVVQHFDLRGAVVTEQLYAQINAKAAQAAQAGALAGRAMAAEDAARKARRRLG